MNQCTLLGPQTPRSNLRTVLDRLDVSGPVAVITAGWRDGEGQIEEMQQAIERDCVDLMLYHRTETVLLADHGLRTAHRERQKKLKELQRLYRIRLRAAMRAVRKLMEAEGDKTLIRHEQRAAISQLRALDRHHLNMINSLRRSTDSNQRSLESASLSAEREAVLQKLEPCKTVLIAGGHVAVLLNRIRDFGLRDSLAERRLVTWSAGAMAISDRIVLFHDHTPQGPVTEEVLDAGLGLVPNIVPLPAADRRLNWTDPVRLSIFCRRFAPAMTVTLNLDSMLVIDDSGIADAETVTRLLRTGRAQAVVAR